MEIEKYVWYNIIRKEVENVRFHSSTNVIGKEKINEKTFILIAIICWISFIFL